MNKLIQPGRRDVIAGGVALAGAMALPSGVGAAQAGLAPASDLLAAMRKFASTLEPDKLKAASFRLERAGMA